MFSGILQPSHLVLILVIALIVFGPSKLPELGASLGKGLREFKSATDDLTEIKDTVKGSVDSVKTSVNSAVSLEPTRPSGAATPLPAGPEARHEAPVVLRRQEID